ncbi:hypothetical protein BXY57_2422 [Thermoflavifilum aggregans]|uniref:Uncharacterized protein n=2 Tax=Thermoflavifilum aggregans TaxID=454188 RepID=A0A2M9CY03_9BACT|nr:hypothetical protein BXY57_2422 [Thermoflavifilum aggregans]
MGFVEYICLTMKWAVLIWGLCIWFSCRAQDNYEIQVYGSDIVEPHHTMVELHSNYTLEGSTQQENGVLPTRHVFHETVEITHGFNEWFETGVYFFNSLGSDGRTAYVGSHLRPRVAVPERLHWPVGVSLSMEFGFQKRSFNEDTWMLEIRPIIDKTLGTWYFSLNPTFEKSLKGLNAGDGFVFSPNIKIDNAIFSWMAVGMEYYGSIGPPGNFPPVDEQQHQLFLAFDFFFSPEWELNAGYGWGLTPSTDRDIVKLILGRRF